MKLLGKFDCMGLPPVPWSVPDIAVVGRGRGTPRRIAKVPKALRDWQDYLRNVAIKATPPGPIHLGPTLLDLTFLARTPKGKRHGELWCPEVRFNPESEKYVKHGSAYRTPDLTNLTKACEDTLEGLFFGNDGQTCVTMARRQYGPRDGVKVIVYAIDPGDFPGIGEPVA